MNNNFSLIARSDGELLLLIFENSNKKENAIFSIINNQLKITYPNNNNILFNLSTKEKNAIFLQNKILVTELDCKNSISNGKIIDTYIINKA